MVRLTTAHYYTPSGRGIQKPYNNGVEEYRRDYMERFSSGQLFSADSVHITRFAKVQNPCKWQDVYGGGGIMPDVFIPVDTLGLQ
jgi:carboxyl-terminal processing protease